MQDYIICTPVMLPASEKAITQLHTVGASKTIRLSKEGLNLDICKPQHLYLFSHRDINEGDWIINFQNANTPDLYKSTGLKGKYNTRKLVEASTDPTLPLPLIPASFIAKWASEQGEIKYVKVETWEYRLCAHLNHTPNTPRRQVGEEGESPFGEVHILPIEDKTYNPEELKKAIVEGIRDFGQYLRETDIRNMRSQDIKRWAIQWADTHY